MEKLKKERTLKVAMSLFSRHGIKNINLKDVAGETSSSMEDLKKEFGNKSGLLLDCTLMEINHIGNSLRNLISQSISPLEKFIQTCIIVFRYSRSNCPLFYKDLSYYPETEEIIAEFRGQIREICKNYLYQGSIEGYFISGVNYENLVYIFIEELDNTPFKNQHFVMITFLQNILTGKGGAEILRILTPSHSEE